MRRFLVLAAFFLALGAAGAWASPLTPQQAAGAVGRPPSAASLPASTSPPAAAATPPSSTLGTPTHQDFTIVIWGNHRPNFNPPPEYRQGKRLCVTRKIKLYRGTPEVVAHGTGQIRFEK